MKDNTNEETASSGIGGISGILGDPEGVIRNICETKGRGLRGLSPLGMRGLSPVLLAVGGAALFGFAAGCFVDWNVALVDAAKSGGIVLLGYLLCLPTLYVFAAINGCRVGFARLFTVGFVVVAGMGCVLAALAPVLWLFAVSTESVLMFTLLALVLIAVAVAFGFRILTGAVRAGVVKRRTGLTAWFVIFLVVALQSITLMRPMLSPLGTERTPSGKCLFIRHFYMTVTEEDAR